MTGGPAAGLARPPGAALRRFTGGRDALIPIAECLALACFVALIWAAIWVSLANERRSAELTAIEKTDSLAAAFADGAQRLVSEIDQTLLSLRAADAADLRGFDIKAWAGLRNRSDRLMVQIALAGPTGIVTHSTSEMFGPPVNVADREHFRVQQNSSADELFISKPVFGRVTHKWTVQFSRKLRRPDGGFGGIAVISVGCDELSQFYQSIDTGGFVLLAARDGIVRARGPLEVGDIGSDLHAQSYFSKLLSADQGSFRARRRADGTETTLSFRYLPDRQLLVIVGVHEDAVLAGYRATRNRWIGLGVIATAVVGLLGAFWIVQRIRSATSRRALRVTLDSMSQGIVMIDDRGRVPVMNRRAAQLLELPDIFPDGSDGRLAAFLDGIGATGLAVAIPGPAIIGENFECAAVGVDECVAGSIERGGRTIEVRRHETPFGGAVLTYTDVTERRRDEARILHLAHHDILTGLGTRVVLTEQVAEALRRGPGRMFALICLDLDGFKDINDWLGHDVGDHVLVEAARRLGRTVRASDTVVRAGGDEFTILVRGLDAPDRGERIAAKLLEALADDMWVEGQRCVVGASAGVAVFPTDGLTEKELLKHADIALYRAKEEGRGRVRRFDLAMCHEFDERRWLQRELRIALQNNEIEVHYQPQFTADTLAVTGIEALARWRHPERGFIPPAIFIPLAEECGVIIPIGRLVLERACAFAASLPRRCRVAVNLSPAQFRDADLPDLVGRILREAELPADLLELEITEGVLIRDEQQALRTLSALRDLGVHMALDDFGTGYSSLSYLRRFPFDRVKIDRSFVQAQQEDERAAAILEAVLAMSRRLGLRVTAEGVETEQQLDALRRQGCTDVQGFLLGRPMPPTELRAFLNKADAEERGPADAVAREAA